MKLSRELKEKIDNYFNNISTDKLVEISLLKYGFSESKSNIDIENQSFSTLKKSFYKGNNTYFFQDDPYPLVA